MYQQIEQSTKPKTPQNYPLQATETDQIISQSSLYEVRSCPPQNSRREPSPAENLDSSDDDQIVQAILSLQGLKLETEIHDSDENNVLNEKGPKNESSPRGPSTSQLYEVATNAKGQKIREGWSLDEQKVGGEKPANKGLRDDAIYNNQ